MTSQCLPPDKTSSPGNQTNSEAGSSSSGAESEVMTSSNKHDLIRTETDNKKDVSLFINS